jgi:hypothetical protein
VTGREAPERAAAGLSLVSSPDTFAAGQVLSEADLNEETRADDRARSGQVLVPDPDEEQLAGILIRQFVFESPAPEAAGAGVAACAIGRPTASSAGGPLLGPAFPRAPVRHCRRRMVVLHVGLSRPRSLNAISEKMMIQDNFVVFIFRDG